MMLTAAHIGRRGLPCTIIGAALLTLSAAGTSCAAVLNLPNGPYSYTVIDQDVSTALHEFGANLNLKIVVSPEVKGRIQGRLPEGTAREFLDRMIAGYNLEPYYDGSVLYITSAQENRTQLLALSPIPYDRLKTALDSLGISDPRFPIRPAPGRGVAMVSGPPRYVALVEQTLAGLVAEERARVKPVIEVAPSQPPEVKTFTVYRGGQMVIIRAGRPEYVGGFDAGPTQRAGAIASGAGPGNDPARNSPPQPAESTSR